MAGTVTLAARGAFSARSTATHATTESASVRWILTAIALLFLGVFIFMPLVVVFAEALRKGRRAVELCPIEKDAFLGAAMVKYLAMIAAWVGEKDLACEQLAIATRRPGDLSYGQLKLMPFWDLLRGDPRFEKLVEEVKNRSN